MDKSKRMTRQEALQYVAEANSQEERIVRKDRVFGILYGHLPREVLEQLKVSDELEEEDKTEGEST